LLRNTLPGSGSRQSSDTGTPLSACFNIPIICASLYFFFFIQNLLSQYAKKIPLVNTTFFRGDYHRRQNATLAKAKSRKANAPG